MNNRRGTSLCIAFVVLVGLSFGGAAISRPVSTAGTEGDSSADNQGGQLRTWDATTYTAGYKGNQLRPGMYRSLDNTDDCSYSWTVPHPDPEEDVAGASGGYGPHFLILEDGDTLTSLGCSQWVFDPEG